MSRILHIIGTISNLLMLLFLLMLGVMLINETITGNTLFTNNQLLGFIIIMYALLKVIRTQEIKTQSETIEKEVSK